MSESLNGESYGCHRVQCSHWKSNKCYFGGESALFVLWKMKIFDLNSEWP